MPSAFPTRLAAELLGMKRPQFVAVARLLCLPTQQKTGTHGGSPHKLYSKVTVDLLWDFLTQCRERGGEAVLKGLLGRGR